MLKAVFDSFCRCLIRFFDNRFIPDNTVEHYRMELAKHRQDYLDLVEQVINPKRELFEDEEQPEMQPIQKVIPWHVKQRQLEMDSFRRAQELAAEAKEQADRSKSTEQLEAELLTGTEE